MTMGTRKEGGERTPKSEGIIIPWWYLQGGAMFNRGFFEKREFTHVRRVQGKKTQRNSKDQ